MDQSISIYSSNLNQFAMPHDEQAAQAIFRQAPPAASTERNVKNYAKRKFHDEEIDPDNMNKRVRVKHPSTIITDARRWTPGQDEHLAELVSLHKNRWTQIAGLMARKFPGFGKIGKQCGERWNNWVNPEINRDEWTKEEDALLLKKYKEFGTSWKKYKMDFPDRSQNAIKNRWNSIKITKERQGISQTTVAALAKPILTKKNIPTQPKRQYTKRAKVTEVSSISEPVTKVADSLLPRKKTKSSQHKEHREEDSLTNPVPVIAPGNKTHSHDDCEPVTVMEHPFPTSYSLWGPSQETDLPPFVLSPYSEEYLSFGLGSPSPGKSDSDLSDFADIAHLFDDSVGL